MTPANQTAARLWIKHELRNAERNIGSALTGNNENCSAEELRNDLTTAMQRLTACLYWTGRLSVEEGDRPGR